MFFGVLWCSSVCFGVFFCLGVNKNASKVSSMSSVQSYDKDPQYDRVIRTVGRITLRIARVIPTGTEFVFVAKIL